MQKFWKSLASLIFLFLISINVFAQNISADNKNDIRKVSEKFHEVIASSHGEKLLPLVSNNTLNFYEQIKNLSLYANKEELLKKDLHFVFCTILTRQLFSFEKLKKMSPEDFFAESYTGHTSILNRGVEASIDNFVVKDEKNVDVQYELSSSDTPLFLPYKKESGKWKVNIEAHWDLYFNKFLWPELQKAKNQGYTREEFIVFFLKNQFGIKENNPFKPLSIKR